VAIGNDVPKNQEWILELANASYKKEFSESEK
jgi:hypothetical protein